MLWNAFGGVKVNKSKIFDFYVTVCYNMPNKHWEAFDMAKCPRCGSLKFRYELRAAGTRSKSNYYRTGFGDNWIIPAGQKTYKSQRKQKSVGFCPDCGYIEEKQERGCLFYLLCLLFFPISLSVWFYRTDLIRLDKKWKALIIAALWAILLICAATAPDTDTGANLAASTNSANGTTYGDELIPDYIDAESLEAALNAGLDVTGKTVQFSVLKFVPDSAFGYNMQAGEHLNFCSDTDPNVSVEDTVIVEVTKVSTWFGSYIISYKMR